MKAHLINNENEMRLVFGYIDGDKLINNKTYEGHEIKINLGDYVDFSIKQNTDYFFLFILTDSGIEVNTIYPQNNF